MTVRSYTMLAAAVGLWLANPFPRHAAGQGTAGPRPDEPGRLGVQPGQALAAPPVLSANQQLANTVAAHLRLAGQLRRFRIDLSAQDGVVELTGQVVDEVQREEALRIVHGVQGVSAVRDLMVVSAEPSVTRTTAVTTAPAPGPAPLLEPGPLGRGMSTTQAPAGPPPEPTPIFSAPPGLSYASMNPPPLPPYAWPTFAPYNNYSRVAYPQLYPSKAWPFIGPQYPFPKVPLGWRSVQLTYYNGHWWYGKTASGHDWWRIRYW